MARLLRASLLHHRRAHLGAALGAAVACAVLTGALLVGDSVRGSLRALTLERLGRVDLALLAERPFGAQLAARLGERPGVTRRFEPPVAALMLRGSAAAPGADGAGRRVGGLSVLGVDGAGLEMLTLPGEVPPSPPRGRKALVNRRLAGDLGLEPGDPLVLALEPASGAPRESFAGRRDDPARSLRLEVEAVIDDRGPGMFSLGADQRVPRIAIVDPAELARALGMVGRPNALFLSSRGGGGPGARGQAAAQLIAGPLKEALEVEDLGLRVRALEERGLLQIESETFQMSAALERAVVEAAEALGAPVEKVLTYLANAIRLSRPGEPVREIPYSTVSAVDASSGALESAGGGGAASLGPGEIILGAWAAGDLGAREGDAVELEYFLPGEGGELATGRSGFRVRGMAPATMAAIDPALTPEFPGITSAERIGDWDPPFPVDLKRIRPRDEEYWKAHRAAPKAFISLEEGRKLWESRFGGVTALRVGALPGKSLAETERLLRDALRARMDPAKFGLLFRAVRDESLEASAGATDFSVLFLAFSFFLIAAAALLSGLLWAIGLHRRAREWGILRALGLSGRSVSRLAVLEGLCVTGTGALLGAALAPLHAAVLLSGLMERWSPSTRPPRLDLHAAPLSFVIGYLASVAVVAAATALASRTIARSTPRSLLAGGWGRAARGGNRRQDGGGRDPAGVRRTALPRVAAPLLGGVLVAAALGLTLPALLSGDIAARAGPAAFFGAGAALLAGGAMLLGGIFFSGLGSGSASGRRPSPSRSPGPPGRPLSILRLGFRNARTHPGRSTLTVCLMASAAFVVVAAGAVRRGEDPEEGERTSGTGGFALVATSDVPIFRRLDDPAGREALGVEDAIGGAPIGWREAEVMAFRVREGDDASCLNLYRASRPRILGAPEEMVRRGGFRFHSIRAAAPREAENPWQVLERLFPDGATPAIADEATATWVLRKGIGDEVTVVDGRGAPARLRLMGLLEGSILQGSLIVAEKDLLSLYPDTSGYRFFLIGAPPGEVERMRQALAEALGPFGFDPVPARRLLAEFRSVEHAYLETFRALGGMGLLLGAAGLGAVLLRGTMERRGELATLRALGYRRAALSTMVLAENAFLVAAGLGLGAASALLAAAPHLARGASPVPWIPLALTLLGAAAVGLGAGLLAIRAALRTPLLPALREN